MQQGPVPPSLKPGLNQDWYAYTSCFSVRLANPNTTVA